MDENQFDRLRPLLTSVVTLSVLAILTWGHFHGGVPSHHLLHRADMPAISDWWGGLLLPALTWFVLSRIHKRLIRPIDGAGEASKRLARVAIWFVGSLLFGLLFAATFLMGFEDLTSYLFFGLLLLVLFLPVFRAECMLGFVFGMSIAFGAVLPTMIGSLIAILSALGHYLIRPILGRVWALFRSKRSSATGRNRSSGE